MMARHMDKLYGLLDRLCTVRRQIADDMVCT